MSSLDPIEPPPWGGAPPPAAAGEWGPPDLARRPDSTLRPPLGLEPPDDPVATAYEEGRATGQQEGRIHALTELEPIRVTLRALIANLERDQLAARQAAADNIHALALVVARWLFQQRVEHDPAVVEALIRRAVSLLPPGTPIEVRANPVDLTALGEHLDLREPDGRPLAIHWMADPGIERGSFTLSSPERLVDGRADVALRSLYERLAGS